MKNATAKKSRLIIPMCLIFLNSVFDVSAENTAIKKNEDKNSKHAVMESIYKPVKTKRDYWPDKEWKTKIPEQAGMDSSKLKLMEDYAFKRSFPEKERKGIRTDSVLIIRNGYLVFEKYGGSFNREKPHLTWSVAKSFVNALFGIAVMEKRLRVEDFAFKYYPALNRGNHKNIKIDDLLRMSSGLYSNETYEASFLKSTVTAMLFSADNTDMAKYAASQDFESETGKQWEYASTSPNLLMAMLKNTMTAKEYDSYPWDKLFNKIGMKKVIFEQDASGTFVGSSYLYTRPADMAKFGYLYLNDGVWNGNRILPEGWVKYTTSIAPAFNYQDINAPEELKKSGTYGALWWLNRSLPERKIPKAYPAAPEDMFSAQGHWGQFIFVIPSLDMVIVYTGDNRDKSFDKNKFLKLIIESVIQEKAK